MSSAELARFYQARARNGRKVTNNPTTWPICDRQLTPSERSYLSKADLETEALTLDDNPSSKNQRFTESA